MNFLNNLTFKILTSTRTLLNGEGGVPTLKSDVDDLGIFARVWDAVKTYFINTADLLYNMLAKLLILVSRFMLNVIDFLFVLVRQFIGTNTPVTDLESLTDDKIFDFIFHPDVIRVIKYMIILGLILIILFSIIAVIKAEYGNLTGEGNSKKHVLVNAIKSCFMMVIIPLLFIFGIIMSNVVLQEVYMATASGNNITISSHIWNASTYQANAFRNYAENDLKIPITYNFVNETEDGAPFNYDKISTVGTSSDLENALIEYANQQYNLKGAATKYMFSRKAFFAMTDIETSDEILQSAAEPTHSAYYTTYDNNLYFKQVEYYVMADVIDYCLLSSDVVRDGFYYMSINDLYENHYNVYGYEDTSLPITKDENGNYTTSMYYAGNDEPTTYVSPANTHSESEGTVYTICYLSKVMLEGDIEAQIYMPLVNNKDLGFKTSYIETKNSIVIARGVFNNEGCPTAIRDSNGEIQFYRDEIYTPMLVDFFPTITYELPEGQKDSNLSWFLRTGFEVLTGLDSDELIPHFYFNFDVYNWGKNVEVVENQLADGNFVINYSMNKANLKTENVYNINKINLLVLIIPSVILITVFLNVVFGLISRIFDMVVLAISYPVVASSIPLDNGAGLSRWTDEFMGRLLCIFGVTVSVNFVVLITPTIMDFDFFTAESLTEMPKMASTIIGITPTFANILVRVLFLVVGFSLLSSFTRWLNFILNGTDYKTASKIFKTFKKSKRPIKGGSFEEVIDIGYESLKDPQKSTNKAFLDRIGASGIYDSGLSTREDALSTLNTATDHVTGKKAVSVWHDVSGYDSKSKKHNIMNGALGRYIPGGKLVQGIVGGISDVKSGKTTGAYLKKNNNARAGYAAKASRATSADDI